MLAKLRRSYVRAGTLYKRQLLDQAVALLGYHRKAAIRALRAGPPPPRPPGLLLGRPKTYHPETLLPIVKLIWFAAFQPCSVRLHALLPEWLPAYETDPHRLDADRRQTLLSASPRTWDRLLAPWRVAGRRFTGTRPGSLLRQSIPIRGEWTEPGAGWLELDTVALCGGCLDDRHLWMLDGVDIGTDWTRVRQHFGYERYDNPAVTPLINTLCAGALGQLLNHFLPTLKLERKERRGTRTVRQYGDPQTPYVRVLAAAEVSAQAKARLQALPATLNPFQLGRDIERQKKQIEARRRLAA